MDEFQPLKTSVLLVTTFEKEDVTDEELYNHFESHYPDGHIVSCKIGRGGSSNSCREAALVEYASHEQAKIAIKLLDSTKLKDYTIYVRFSFIHEDNTQSIIYLKNFDKSIGKDYLHKLLSPYGNLLVIQLHTDADDASGQSSGTAAVQYDSVEAAQTALKGLNGRLIMNKKIHVSSSEHEPRTDDEDGNSIFLRILVSYVPKQYFWQTLGRFGRISSVRLIEKFPKGEFFAKVVFKNPADAAKAADALRNGLDPKLACLRRFRDRSEEESTKKEAPGAPHDGKHDKAISDMKHQIALLEVERDKAVSQIAGIYNKEIFHIKRHVTRLEVEQNKAMYRWNRNTSGNFPAPKKMKLDKAQD